MTEKPSTEIPSASQWQPIFVFGSNLAGRHGKGAALFALKNHGAHYGQGIGLQGASYAIATKDAKLRVLPLSEIKGHVENFLIFDASCPDLTFQLTPVGCGLAGYSPTDIAPMFSGAPSNVHLPIEFREVLNKTPTKQKPDGGCEAEKDRLSISGQ